MDVLTDGEFHTQITVGANLAVERPSLKIVGEAPGNLSADSLGLFIADGAESGEPPPWATFYLQPSLVFLAVTTRPHLPSATGCESGQEYYPGKHDCRISSHDSSQTDDNDSWNTYVFLLHIFHSLLLWTLVEDPTVVAHTGFTTWPPRALVVEALEPAVLRVLEGEAFYDLVRRNPEVGVKTIRVLGERLSTCEVRLSDLVRKEVPARLASLILGLSEYQGVVTVNGSRMIPTRYTHNHLASMVGSNREALTKALGRLKREGGLEVKNRRIHVVDADVLTRIAGSGR